MQKQDKLFRIGFDEYTTSDRRVLPAYRPVYSEGAIRIQNLLEKKYPALSFVVFESVLLNEFLNHLIAQNTFYVQVEKDVSEYVFDDMKQEYEGAVLYKPNKAEYIKYWMRDCVVVLELISQAPLSSDEPHEMTAEKMLVDIIAEKSIAAVYSPAELPEIFAHMKKNYRLDAKKMNRYAGRRGKAEQVRKYMKGEA